MNSSYSSTAEINSSSQGPQGIFYPAHNTLNTSFHVFSTQSGLMDFDERDDGGTWHEIHSNEAITANDATIVVFTFGVLPMRVRFTPAAATAGTIRVEARNRLS